VIHRAASMQSWLGCVQKTGRGGHVRLLR
jgi:hypothetical protein